MTLGDLAAVDASVVVKWQLDDEECVAEARALRNDLYGKRILRVIAPTLLVYELANALATSTRRKRIAAALAVEGMADLMAVGVELQPARQPGYHSLADFLEEKLGIRIRSYTATSTLPIRESSSWGSSCPSSRRA